MKRPLISFFYLKPVWLCFLSIALFSFSLAAQQHDIDSLCRILKTAKQDTNRVSATNYLSFLMHNTGDYTQSDSLAQQALQLAQQINYRKGIAIAYTNIASNYDDKGDYTNALQFYEKALKIKEQINDKHGTENTLNGIGLVYEKKGDYLQATGYYSEALKICQETNDQEGSAIALDNIGKTYQEQSNYPKALENDFKALKISENIADTVGMAYSYEYIGNCYNDLEDYAKALDYYKKALPIMEKAGDMPTVADLFSNIGLIYSAQGNYENALEQYFKSLEINQKTGNTLGIADCYDHIGESYLQQEKYAISLDYCTKGLDIYKKIGYKQGIAKSLEDIGVCYMFQKNYKVAMDYENNAINAAKEIGALQIVQTATQTLSNIFESTGDDKKALLYYKNFIVLRDSIYNASNSKKAVQTEMNYEFDKKQAVEKAEQEKKDAIATAESKRQKIFMLFIMVIAIAIGVIAVIIFRSLRITRKQKVLIEKQKSIVEQQKAVVEEQKTLVEGKNKEILDSITYAKRLQDAILPPVSLIKQYLPESFVFYKPKDIVAGDFYWMERAGNITLIAAADCTGHGVPGAMVSVVCSNALNRTVKEFNIIEPGKILDKVRELVLETFEKSESDVKDGMDISLCCINASTNEINWSGAYNPLWYIQNGELKELKPDKQPIGRFDTAKPFNTTSVKLNKGDTLYLFTDGYADQFGGPKGKKFKYKQLEELLLVNAVKTMEEQKSKLESVLEEWKGELEQVDDVLIIGIRV